MTVTQDTIRPPINLTATRASIVSDNTHSTHDVGLQVLADVAAFMQIDEEWSLRDGRKLEWWMGQFPQQLRARPSVQSVGYTVCRLVASTIVLRDVPLTDHTYKTLSLVNARAMHTSALVVDGAGTVFFTMSVIAHEAVMTRMAKLLSFCAALQAGDAERSADSLADVLGGVGAQKPHPASGIRHQVDDLSNLSARLVVPQGEQPSLFRGPGMKEALELLQRTSMLAGGNDAGLTAEFPYRKASSLLQLDTDERHLHLGHGLRVTLRLWEPPFDRSPYECAALLNAMEAKGVDEILPLMGAWCVGPTEAVAFHAFFPNACAQQVPVGDIVLWMARRANWVAGLQDPRTREERYAQGMPAVYRAIADMSDEDFE